MTMEALRAEDRFTEFMVRHGVPADQVQARLRRLEATLRNDDEIVQRMMPEVLRVMKERP